MSPVQGHESVVPFWFLFSQFTCMSVPRLPVVVLILDLFVNTFRPVSGFTFSALVCSPKVALRVLGELEEPANSMQSSCFGR